MGLLDDELDKICTGLGVGCHFRSNLLEGFDGEAWSDFESKVVLEYVSRLRREDLTRLLSSLELGIFPTTNWSTSRAPQTAIAQTNSKANPHPSYASEIVLKLRALGVLRPGLARRLLMKRGSLPRWIRTSEFAQLLRSEYGWNFPRDIWPKGEMLDLSKLGILYPQDFLKDVDVVVHWTADLNAGLKEDIVKNLQKSQKSWALMVGDHLYLGRSQLTLPRFWSSSLRVHREFLIAPKEKFGLSSFMGDQFFSRKVELFLIDKESSVESILAKEGQQKCKCLMGFIFPSGLRFVSHWSKTKRDLKRALKVAGYDSGSFKPSRAALPLVHLSDTDLPLKLVEARRNQTEVNLIFSPLTHATRN